MYLGKFHHRVQTIWDQILEIGTQWGYIKYIFYDGIKFKTHNMFNNTSNYYCVNNT